MIRNTSGDRGQFGLFRLSTLANASGYRHWLPTQADAFMATQVLDACHLQEAFFQKDVTDPGRLGMAMFQQYPATRG